MTSRDFCYWLQGFFEISGAKRVSDAEVETIKNHLAMVFKHEIDPSHGDDAHQAELSALHEGGGSAVGSPKPQKRPPRPPGGKVIYRC